MMTISEYGRKGQKDNNGATSILNFTAFIFILMSLLWSGGLALAEEGEKSGLSGKRIYELRKMLLEHEGGEGEEINEEMGLDPALEEIFFRTGMEPYDFYDTGPDGSSISQSGENVEVVGRWLFGPSLAVTVGGNYAYLGSGGGIFILDISNPASPIKVAEIATRYLAFELFLAGNRLYVAEGPGGLSIIDVSDPSSPIEVGYYNLPGPRNSWVFGVYVSGNYAYLAAGRYGGFRVIDVSDSTSPTEVGYYNSPGDARKVCVSGNYAYLADGEAGIRVIDVSNPTLPTEVGYYNSSSLGDAYEVYVAGSYAYLAAGYDGLKVVDIADPTSPTEVGSYDSPDGAYKVYVSGNYAYLSAGRDGLKIIDVSDHTSPTEVGYYNSPGWAYEVYVSGNYAYLSAGRDGLKIIDVSNPIFPTEVSCYDLADGVKKVYVSGSYAYLANRYNGLKVIDIADPTSPTEIGSYDSPGLAKDVYVSGSYAYLADGEAGLRVIDISNPASPTEVAYYDSPGYGGGVYVSGNYAYLADGRNGLRIIDVSNPTSPMEVGYYDSPGFAKDVYVSGSYAHLADGKAGLRIIDISNPSSPIEIGYCNSIENWVKASTRGVYVSGSYTYLANWNGLWVIDVSILSSPSVVGFLVGLTEEVYVSGSYAYLADNWKGCFKVIDVSDPTSPTEVGFYGSDSLWRAFGVYVSDGYAYLANGWGGFSILRYTGPQPTIEISPTSFDVTLEQGERRHRIMTISNTGDRDLTFKNINSSGWWLSEEPTSGTIIPGSHQEIVITFDTIEAWQEVGTYSTTIQIENSDPKQPLVEIPVTLTVGQRPFPPPSLPPTNWTLLSVDQDDAYYRWQVNESINKVYSRLIVNLRQKVLSMLGGLRSAITVYYADREVWPQSLEDLVPEYITKIPEPPAGSWVYDPTTGEVTNTAFPEDRSNPAAGDYKTDYVEFKLYGKNDTLITSYYYGTKPPQTNEIFDVEGIRRYLYSLEEPCYVAYIDVHLHLEGSRPELEQRSSYILTTKEKHHTFPAGWNLSSLPLEPVDLSPEAVFGDDVTCLPYFLFGYENGAYSAPDALHLGNAYWLWLDCKTTVDVMGREFLGDLIVSLDQGWNLVGTPATFEIDFSSARVRRGGEELTLWEAAIAAWIYPYLYGYDPEIEDYYRTQRMAPWIGYWFYVFEEGCELIITQTPAEGPITAPVLSADMLSFNLKPPTPPAGLMGNETSVPPPTQTLLFQNYPNPLTPQTYIPYLLSEPARVVINIYDLSGALIRRLDLGEQKPGRYLTKTSAACWDGRDEAGQEVSSGTYLYQLKAGSTLSTRKMLVVK